METLFYEPLPAKKARPPIICEYQYQFPTEPSLYLCQFTRGRCGPADCPLKKFDSRPMDESYVQGLAHVPFHITFVS